MARYIDVDKFIERIEASPAFPNMGEDGFFLREVVINLLNSFPTADVVPRAEVAREIFEEVDKALERNYYDHPFEYYASYLRFQIANLKKKYTEEQK